MVVWFVCFSASSSFYSKLDTGGRATQTLLLSVVLKQQCKNAHLQVKVH